jgi:hypothetical protein
MSYLEKVQTIGGIKMEKPKLKQAPPYYDFFEVRDYITANFDVTKREWDRFWNTVCEMYSPSNGDYFGLSLDKYSFKEFEEIKKILITEFTNGSDWIQFHVEW